MKPLKNLIATSIFLSLFTGYAHAQVKLSSDKKSDIPYYKNEIGIEAGGNCLIYSAYYQRALYRKGNTQFNIRIGGSYVPAMGGYSGINDNSTEYNLVSYILPNVLFFKKRHAWEIGLGVNMFANFHKETITYYNNPYEDKYIDNTQLYFITPQLGYRAYLKNSKFYFRAAVSTFFYVAGHNNNTDYVEAEPKVLPWGAVGFGYCFGKK